MARKALTIYAVALVVCFGALSYAYLTISKNTNDLVQLATRYSTEASNEDTVAHVSKMMANDIIGLLDLHDNLYADPADTKQLMRSEFYRNFDNAVRNMFRETRIIKVKVFARDGDIVYSSDSHDVGKDHSDQIEVIRALRGKSTSSINHHEGAATNRADGRKNVVVSSYHALQDQGNRIRGVVEVYTNRSRTFEMVEHKLESNRAKTFLILLGLGLLLITPLTFIVFFYVNDREEIAP